MIKSAVRASILFSTSLALLFSGRALAIEKSVVDKFREAHHAVAEVLGKKLSFEATEAALKPLIENYKKAVDALETTLDDHKKDVVGESDLTDLQFLKKRMDVLESLGADLQAEDLKKAVLKSTKHFNELCADVLDRYLDEQENVLNDRKGNLKVGDLANFDQMVSTVSKFKMNEPLERAKQISSEANAKFFDKTFKMAPGLYLGSDDNLYVVGPPVSGTLQNLARETADFNARALFIEKTNRGLMPELTTVRYHTSDKGVQAMRRFATTGITISNKDKMKIDELRKQLTQDKRFID
ncbi:MAG: hypothetical protein V1495_11265 [Pseudomonadota bacterium]